MKRAPILSFHNRPNPKPFFPFFHLFSSFPLFSPCMVSQWTIFWFFVQVGPSHPILSYPFGIWEERLQNTRADWISVLDGSLFCNVWAFLNIRYQSESSPLIRRGLPTLVSHTECSLSGENHSQYYSLGLCGIAGVCSQSNAASLCKTNTYCRHFNF